MNVQSIPLDRVAVGTRLRAVDEAYAALLADSIAEHGLRTPIEVREPDEGGRYHLVAGAHRVAAARLLGFCR